MGVIDLLINKQLSWEKATISIGVEKGTLDLIKSGMKDENYFNNVSSLNFECYYKEGGGEKIEELRNEWINNYDFVLIDSRTGITDIGGVCTIHLPDIVVLMFTPTKQAIDGIVRVSKKAAQAQKELPYDRQRLFFVPIISRVDSLQEKDLLQEWLEFSDKQCNEIFKNWLSKDTNSIDMLDFTKIPYVSFYSFGEKLAVDIDRSSNPSSLRRSYENLAALLANKLENTNALINNRDSYIRKASYARNQKSDDSNRTIVIYTQEDEKWARLTLKHIGVAIQSNIDSWNISNRDFIPRPTISYKNILLLVSADFLAKLTIKSQENSLILQDYIVECKLNGSRVIPIITRPCAWPMADWLFDIQRSPQNMHALSALNKHDIDLTLSEITNQLAHSIINPANKHPSKNYAA